jgi:hypothetical protein
MPSVEASVSEEPGARTAGSAWVGSGQILSLPLWRGMAVAPGTVIQRFFGGPVQFEGRSQNRPIRGDLNGIKLPQGRFGYSILEHRDGA